jgi:hypothetical protein
MCPEFDPCCVVGKAVATVRACSAECAMALVARSAAAHVGEHSGGRTHRRVLPPSPAHRGVVVIERAVCRGLLVGRGVTTGLAPPPSTTSPGELVVCRVRAFAGTRVRAVDRARAEGARPPHRPGASPPAHVARVVAVPTEVQEETPGGRPRPVARRARPGRDRSSSGHASRALTRVSTSSPGVRGDGHVGARCRVRGTGATSAPHHLSPSDSRTIDLFEGSDSRERACPLLAEKTARLGVAYRAARREARTRNDDLPLERRWHRRCERNRGAMRLHAGRRTAMRVRTAVTCAGADDPKPQCGVSRIVGMPLHVGATLSRR